MLRAGEAELGDQLNCGQCGGGGEVEVEGEGADEGGGTGSR